MITAELVIAKRELKRRRNEEICSDFKALQNQYPDIELSALIGSLAEKYSKGDVSLKGIAYPMSAQQIRTILIQYGLYTPRKYSKR